MNHKFIELAEQSDFCMWTDESWRPVGATIDWGADYDKEFQQYSVNLMRFALEDFYRNRFDITGEDIVVQIEEYIKSFEE